MKPHRLIIEALGPYRGTEEVDFDALAAEGLFLLHGPTGSGKTFILDAMAFALYGAIPGARTTDGIRSDFAPPGARPAVTLEFTAQGHRYRVERSPAHERPKKRGTGTTSEGPRGVLQVRDGSGWSTVVAKPTEVTAEIEDLLGLDVEQFKQVVMLPQGGFQRVLRAGSDDRERLLKTLFDIRSFDAFTQWLADRAREAAAAEDRARDLLADRVERTRDDHRKLAADLGVELPPEPGEDEPPPDLATLVDEAEGWAAAASVRADEAQNRAGEARSALESTRAGAKLWDRRQAARGELTRLEAAAQPMADVEARLEVAKAAERLRPDMDAVATATRELADAGAALERAVPRLEAALGAAPRLPAEVVGLAGQPPPDDQGAVAALTALAAYRSRLEDLSRREERAVGNLAAADRDEATGAELLARAEAAEAEAERLRTEAEEAETQLEEALRLTETVADLERRHRERVERRGVEEKLAGARARLERAGETVDRLEAELDSARSHLGELRAGFIAGLAGRLARGLVEGEKCPVCGSPEHPEPARPAPGSVEAEEVERAEAQVEAITGRLEEARTRRTDLLGEVARLEGSLAGGEGGGDEATLEAELERAREAEARVPGLRESIRELRERAQGALASGSALRAEAGARVAQVEKARAEARAEMATVAGELGEGVTAAAALGGIGPVEEELAEVRRLVGERAGARARLESATARLEGALESSPFPTGEEARRALLPEPDRRDMAAALERHRRDLIEVRSVLESEEMADLPDERPDVTGAEDAFREAEGVRDRATEVRTLAESGHRDLVEAVADIERSRTRLDELARRAALYGTLADRCGGRRAPRVSLSRWVLAEYLREVCAHANQRLDVMTAGRYRLEVEEEGRRRNRKAGLDLMVHDSHTGASREVNTLSGGETFLASLALALGVADTVQAHTGGVHLDALFVDEGFGTLDADTLQLAVDELDKLREGGRMVGVVSHVSALRERLRTGIEIIPGPRGSTLRQGEIAPL